MCNICKKCNTRIIFKAVEQLNIKANNWKDLINDQPFIRQDIITIQDPNDAMKFNLSTFHHIKNNIRVEDEGKLLLSLDKIISILVFINIFFYAIYKRHFFRNCERAK